jgi:rhodanese-related sulfurtransferase
MFEGHHGLPTVEASGVPADAYLLDVREPQEWADGHAEQACHIPLGALPARLAEVPADRDVYVVCRVGARSAQAAAFLNGNGRTALNVAGGMLAWARAGRPVVAEHGGPPTV